MYTLGEVEDYFYEYFKEKVMTNTHNLLTLFFKLRKRVARCPLLWTLIFAASYGYYKSGYAAVTQEAMFGPYTTVGVLLLTTLAAVLALTVWMSCDLRRKS